MKKLKRILLVVVLIFTSIVSMSTTQTEAAVGRCPAYEGQLATYAPSFGWSVSKMSYIMWRESRCIPTIVNKTGNDTGLLQIHPVTWPYLSRKFGVPLWMMQQWLKIPKNNILAAQRLCRFWKYYGYSCYKPWDT